MIQFDQIPWYATLQLNDPHFVVFFQEKESITYKAGQFAEKFFDWQQVAYSIDTHSKTNRLICKKIVHLTDDEFLKRFLPAAFLTIITFGGLFLVMLVAKIYFHSRASALAIESNQTQEDFDLKYNYQPLNSIPLDPPANVLNTPISIENEKIEASEKLFAERVVELVEEAEKYCYDENGQLKYFDAPQVYDSRDAMLVELLQHGYTSDRAETLVKRSDPYCFQRTLFPLHILKENGTRELPASYYTISLEELISEATEVPITLYHGTTEQAKRSITESGFKLIRTFKKNLDVGYGIYLTKNIRITEGYGKAVIKATLNKNVRLAKLGCNERERYFAQDRLLQYFDRVAFHIAKDVEIERFCQIAFMIKNTLLAQFFKKLGYDALMNSSACLSPGDDYVCVFDPKNIRIEQDNQTS